MGILGYVTAQALIQVLMRTHLEMKDPQYSDPEISLYLETDSPQSPIQLMIGRDLVAAVMEEVSADDTLRVEWLTASVGHTIESVHAGLAEQREFKVLVSL